MLRSNPNYAKLSAGYLFSTIESKVADFQKRRPEVDIIKLGIGDVTGPLSPTVLQAFHEGVDEMASARTFRGYGPYEGYDFLRAAIADSDFGARRVDIAADEIYVSDGAKCDTGNFQELFAPEATVAVPDPVYPVYVDTNVMAGRTGGFSDGRYAGITYIDGNAENDFAPLPPDDLTADMIYLCFPNNPTGATADRQKLTKWVEHAKTTGSLILFDAAYEAFIRDPELPHSIFEIPGAREVAVEFRSLSKTAGFTGARLAYTIVPKELTIAGPEGPVSVADLWRRRQATKFNGVSYPVQKAAAAVFTPEGRREVKQTTDAYLKNAAHIRSTMEQKGYRVWGGENAPYVWIETKGGAWDFFDTLLEEAGVVVTPGVGFGKNGEGFIRISAFTTSDKVAEALARIDSVL